VTETINFKMTVDATGANRALDETRKRAESLGGGLDGLQKGMGQLKERLEKQAAAIAVVSHAFGQHDSAVGKAVSSIGTLAAAYGAGGPFGLALAVAVPLVEKLGSAFDDFQASHQSYALSFDAIGRAAKAAHDASLAPMLETLQGLRRELNTMGMDSIQVAYEDASAIVQSKRAGLERVTAERRAVQAGRMTPTTAKMEGAQRDQYLSALIARQGEAEIALARAESALAEITDTAERIYAARRGGGSGVEPGAKASGPSPAEMEEEALRKMQQVIYGQKVAANKRAHDEMISAALKADEELLKIEEKAARDADRMKEKYHQEDLRRIEEEKAARAAQANQYAGLAGAVAAAAGSAAAAGLAGQEKVFEAFIASASQALGGFVTLKGGELLAMGFTSLLTPGAQGLGAAQIAGGATLVAAGAAISTGGPAMVQSLAGQAGAGGGSGGVSNEAARTSGVGGSRGSGRGTNYGGGGTNITIVYGGASGPTADQGADAVVHALRRARRHGKTPVEVR
jgi:chaperonin cofactor prefoldin